MLAVFMAFPYGLCVVLAQCFRNHRREGWIVFVGTAICAVLGLEGVYAAFFSLSPHDPWKALAPPVYQMGVVILSAGIAHCSFLFGKRGNIVVDKAAAFKTRAPDNVIGKFYVSDTCLDCDFCRTVAPANFARNNEGGYSYIKKQPESPAEEAVCLEAVKGCCTDSIFADGDHFDWAANPAPTPAHLRIVE